MRRVTLAVFFFLAACDGSNVKPQAITVYPGDQAARQAFLSSPEGMAVIASFAKNVSRDALDTCLNAWVEDFSPVSSPEGVASSPGTEGWGPAKPDHADLRSFLAECLRG
jgi:hypothetical protein